MQAAGEQLQLQVLDTSLVCYPGCVQLVMTAIVRDMSGDHHMAAENTMGVAVAALRSPEQQQQQQQRLVQEQTLKQLLVAACKDVDMEPLDVNATIMTDHSTFGRGNMEAESSMQFVGCQLRPVDVINGPHQVMRHTHCCLRPL